MHRRPGRSHDQQQRATSGGGHLNLVLVGEEAAGLLAFQLLAAGPHRLVAVLTGDDRAADGASALGEAARRAGCPVWSARKVRDPALAATLRDHGVDLLLNVHSLFIAHAVVVAAPRVGSFNVHPGPLPAYAGLNAPSWAIYHGETMHAVTIHWMDEGIDSGHIAYETPVAITGRDTGYSLSAKCTRQALRLLENLLAAAAQGADAIPRLPQGGGVRRYHGREAPRSGRLDWRAPARQVVDFIRAADYSPFPSPWGPPRTWADGQELGVVSAATTGRPADAPPGTVGPASEPGVLVAAGDEWVAVRRVRLGETLVDARSVMECGRRLTSDAPTV